MKELTTTDFQRDTFYIKTKELNVYTARHVAKRFGQTLDMNPQFLVLSKKEGNMSENEAVNSSTITPERTTIDSEGGTGAGTVDSTSDKKLTLTRENYLEYFKDWSITKLKQGFNIKVLNMVDIYLICGNFEEAAKKVGFGYSYGRMMLSSGILPKNLQCRALISRLREQKSKQHTELNDATSMKNKVIKKLNDILEGDSKDSDIVNAARELLKYTDTSTVVDDKLKTMSIDDLIKYGEEQLIKLKRIKALED